MRSRRSTYQPRAWVKRLLHSGTVRLLHVPHATSRLASRTFAHRVCNRSGQRKRVADVEHVALHECEKPQVSACCASSAREACLVDAQRARTPSTQAPR